MNNVGPNNPEKLNRFLLANGIAENYIDFSGNTVTIPLENRIRVLKEMGIDLPDEEDLDRSLQSILEGRRGQVIQPVMILGPGSDRIFLQTCSELENQDIQWRLAGDAGYEVGGEMHCKPDESANGFGISVPPLETGYYRFTLTAEGISADSLIIVAPDRIHEPDFLRNGQRLWGVSAQLYSLASRRNWGIGDFTDLQELVSEVAGKGGDFVLLNPLHALDLEHPEQASPYSPVDRRFLNPLYIDPEMTPEAENSSFRQWLEEVNRSGRLESLRKSDQVLYTETFAVKFEAFECLYKVFREECRPGNARADAFSTFIEKGGPNLRRFADFEASCGAGIPGSASDPEFHLYLQWIAESQLAEVQSSARERGMKIGLIRDLAVGATDESFEVRDLDDLFCRNARIGAPPDHFNPQGQNWGLMPMLPAALEQSGFGHFINLLRSNMTSCGALRLDHIMSLMRLWWCPADGPNAAGAYVHYNTDALFAILRLESQNANCMIIGEDLGVVPPEIRTYIYSSGILSNTMFYFERYEGGYFKKPEHYNPRALAIITNHDVPTLKAWWNTSDLDLRKTIGLITDQETFNQEYEARERDKHLLLTMLDEIHLLPEQWLDRDIHKPFDLALFTAIIRTCASSVSSLVSVQLDDLAWLDKPVNIPGTCREYANWRRKVPVPVRELFAREEVDNMLAPLQEERPAC